MKTKSFAQQALANGLTRKGPKRTFRQAGGRSLTLGWPTLCGLVLQRWAILLLAGWRYGRGISSCLQMARTVPSLISRWRGTLAILCRVPQV